MSRIANAFRALFTTKASAAGNIIAYQTLGQPKWSPREYNTFSNEGYKKNVLVKRCIWEVAKSMASIPRCLYSGKKEIESENNPLIKLIEKPNAWQSAPEMWAAHYAFWLLSGDCYLEGTGPDGAPPLELFTHRPDKVAIIPGANGQVQAYEYKAGGRSHTWKMDPNSNRGPILHTKTFNPLDDWLGLSFLESAAFSVDQHNAASVHNKALLENSGRPPGALVYKPDGMTPQLTADQYAKLRKEIDEKISGPENAGYIPVFSGGLEWQEMGLTPVELNWLEGKDSTARDICMAFGVPPQIVGIPGTQTFANYEEARLSFYEETIIPLLMLHTEALNNWLVPTFDPSWHLELDKDEVPALAPRRAKVWEQVQTSDFLTINEKREKLGYSPVDGGEVLFVEASKMPLMGADAGTNADGAPPTLDANGDPLPPGAPPTDTVQQQALNGVQITSATDIVGQVSAGTLAPEAAKLLLQIAFPSEDPARINAMVDAAAKFEPTPPPAQPDPFGGAPATGKPKPKVDPALGQEKSALAKSLEDDGFTKEAAANLIALVYGDGA